MCVCVCVCVCVWFCLSTLVLCVHVCVCVGGGAVRKNVSLCLHTSVYVLVCVCLYAYECLDTHDSHTQMHSVAEARTHFLKLTDLYLYCYCTSGHTFMNKSAVYSQ